MALQVTQGTGPFVKTTQNVEDEHVGHVHVDSAALPTGAATAANQTTLIGHVDGLETLLSAIETAVETLAAAVDTQMQVDIVGALPAGDNNIGNVDLASALPAGSNTIGGVNLAQYTPASGRLPVDGSGVTQPTSNSGIGATSDAAATAGSTGSLNAKMRLMTTQLNTLLGYNDGIESVLATIDADTSALAGAIDGSEMQVDVVSMPSLPAGSNNIGDVDVASLPALPAGSNYIGVVGADGNVAANSADATNPIKAGARYDSTAPTYDSGDVTNLQADARGNLRVSMRQPGADADISAGTIAADGISTGTVGLQTRSALLGYNGTSWDRLKSTSGALDINIASGTVEATIDATAVPVSAASEAIVVAVVDGSGNQITSFGGGGSGDGVVEGEGTAGTPAGGVLTIQGVTSMTPVVVDLGANNDVTLATLPDTSGGDLASMSSDLGTLAGAVAGSEVQVDVISSALPSGASTAANQSTIIGHVDGIEALLTTIDADTSLLAGAISSSRVAVNLISGQSGVAAGSGAAGATVQRVVAATDSPEVAGIGGTSDAAATAGSTGSLNAKMRLMTSQLSNMPKVLDGDYEHVAASQTDQMMGATGAAGDYLAGVLIVPATTSPGAVSIEDGSTNMTIFTGGTDSVSNLVPFFVPLGIISASGGWEITTGANVSCFGVGSFT